MAKEKKKKKPNRSRYKAINQMELGLLGQYDKFLNRKLIPNIIKVFKKLGDK